MRKLIFGLAAAVLVAGMLTIFATPAAAGITKPCWAHLDNDPLSPTFGQYAAVWALGGGHVNHQTLGYDTNLGSVDSYAACVAAFTAAGF